MSTPFYGVFGLFIALAAVVLVRRAYVFYRDNKPRPMATPWNDPRSSLAIHRKIVSRQ